MVVIVLLLPVLLVLMLFGLDVVENSTCTAMAVCTPWQQGDSAQFDRVVSLAGVRGC
ncbi:hypothetical protein AB0D42_26365 [Streptomyces sp. NPDC048304]|uniref:hypothetical protein n=1 Tax=Streptomyces sp. NPDC048304 TaxID=3154820 RepID=UPI0033DD74C6